VRKTWSVPVFALLAGCAVGVPEYPPKWDPLLPPAAAHCKGFEGTYADRGETRDRLSARSLTREIFGDDREWKDARRVALELADDELRVTVYGEEGTLLRRDLRASADEFECDAGKLVIRDKRWVAEDLVMGRENVRLELHRSGRFLVARVQERTYALVFLVVPLAADATHWYRFPRLASSGAAD
jgi:hypothetical protein